MTFKMIKWKKISFRYFFTLQVLYSQQTVTLKQAIEFALQNKADALKAKLGYYQCRCKKILEAKAGALPKVTGNANITYNPIIQEIALAEVKLSKWDKLGCCCGSSVATSTFNQQVFIGLKAAKSKKNFIN